MVKGFLVGFACLLMFYCALVGKMYAGADDDRKICEAAGKHFDDNGLKPWWLTEGKCE